jgi:hypothetical protein
VVQKILFLSMIGEPQRAQISIGLIRGIEPGFRDKESYRAIMDSFFGISISELGSPEFFVSGIYANNCVPHLWQKKEVAS